MHVAESRGNEYPNRLPHRGHLKVSSERGLRRIRGLPPVSHVLLNDALEFPQAHFSVI
jgi:hypothetical protein